MTDTKPLPSQPDQPSIKVSGSLVRSLPKRVVLRTWCLIVRCGLFIFPNYCFAVSNFAVSNLLATKAGSMNKERGRMMKGKEQSKTLSFTLGINSYPAEM